MNTVDLESKFRLNIDKKPNEYPRIANASNEKE
jgi:hypothetical protein